MFLYLTNSVTWPVKINAKKPPPPQSSPSSVLKMCVWRCLHACESNASVCVCVCVCVSLCVCERPGKDCGGPSVASCAVGQRLMPKEVIWLEIVAAATVRPAQAERKLCASVRSNQDTACKIHASWHGENIFNHNLMVIFRKHSWASLFCHLISFGLISDQLKKTLSPVTYSVLVEWVENGGM